MAYCLIKSLASEVIKRLKSGEITPERLMEMTSAERRSFFTEFLGEEHGKNTNALLESKLILKNQQAGIVNWAKTITGLKPEYKRDILSRVEKMDRVLNPAEYDSFLNDLAEKRLGFSVTEVEANKIFESSQEVRRTDTLVDRASKDGSVSRLDYGIALVNFQNLTRDLRIASEKKTVGEVATNPLYMLSEVSGLSKSIVTSLDNSYPGRQGWKVLIDDPKSWAKTYSKSWVDIKSALKGGDPIDMAKAEVYSRENAMNGTYRRMKLDIGIEGEEAYPSALPEKIPVLGRLFKASEQAFNGAAIRLRASYADTLLKEAQKSGVDITDTAMLEGYGIVVNSMTGRGRLPSMLEPAAGVLNSAFFSIRNLKAQFDVLTAHVTDKKVPWVIKRRAAKALAKIIIAQSTIQFISKMINPDSVTFDTSDKDYGNIVIGNHHIDTTAGQAGMMRLVSRLTEKLWETYVKGDATEYGSRTAGEILEDYFANKASPIGRVLIDVLRERTFDYKKPTIGGEVLGLVTPIGVSNSLDLWKDRENTPAMASFLYEFLDFSGVSVNTYEPSKSAGAYKGFK